MAKKERIRMVGKRTFKEMFEEFISAKRAEGIAEPTAINYLEELRCISKYLDIEVPFEQIEISDIEHLIVDMRQSDLAHNSVASYVRILRIFYNWCRREGLSNIEVPKIKDKETIKATYTDEELETLLKRPDKSASFCTYRNWVIVNFLVNSGSRAATVRNIKNKDVDLDAKQIAYRHTKNSKVQMIPLCTYMTNILREYTHIRGGAPDEYLFCNQYGDMLSQNALRLAIVRYNKSKGINNTSLNSFRHTFARKYLVDCKGDAFTLQKLLGHQTLRMTRHYCRIYDSDIADRFDELSPLAQLRKNSSKVKVLR